MTYYDTQYEEEVPEREPLFYSVAIYLDELAYGGPEEGGWWYTTSTFSRAHGEHTKCFKSRDEARLYSDTLYPIVEELNIGRPALSSVLSNGRYTIHISEELPSLFLPTERPYYS